MSSRPFEVVSPYSPQGDQPAAIVKLVAGIHEGKKAQVLMGVTGSGKTFTMAHVIAALNRPTLVISHNKTLAAQLYEEFKELFPHNAVGYFVSYYDYYQPEAYIPQRDIYIEKDSSRNDDLDRLRLSATSNLVSRRDVLLVASVSCIFGLGSPESYQNSVLPISKEVATERDEMLKKLIDLQYARNDIEFKRGTFRVRGDVVELWPSYEEFAYRIEFFDDQITQITSINPISGEYLGDHQSIFIYPAVHYVMPPDRIEAAVASIREEMDHRVSELKSQAKLLEAQRLLARTKYDVELIQEVGVCPGIENYSRHLDGRKPGEKPYTLMDYFPKDFLVIIDESHVTIPQIKAMFNGDKQRKSVLVEHGFRLPSAMDNRPLRFEEFEALRGQTIYVSATPAPFELLQTGGEVVEQIIRPTGLVDGGIPVRTRVGHSFIKQVMAETSAAFGGEHSAHYYFRDNFRADSGIIATMFLLEARSQADQPLSIMRKPFERYAASGEINTEVPDPLAVIEHVAAAFSAQGQDRLDGLTVDCGPWWFNLRPSNTEPLLRLNLEAPTRDECDEHVAKVLALITS